MDVFQLAYDLNEALRRQENADALEFHITQEEMELSSDDDQKMPWTLTVIERGWNYDFGNELDG